MFSFKDWYNKPITVKPAQTHKGVFGRTIVDMPPVVAEKAVAVGIGAVVVVALSVVEGAKWTYRKVSRKNTTSPRDTMNKAIDSLKNTADVVIKKIDKSSHESIDHVETEVVGMFASLKEKAENVITSLTGQTQPTAEAGPQEEEVKYHSRIAKIANLAKMPIESFKDCANGTGCVEIALRKVQEHYDLAETPTTDNMVEMIKASTIV